MAKNTNSHAVHQAKMNRVSPNMQAIIDFSVKARELGMTYGQLQAYVYTHDGKFPEEKA